LEERKNGRETGKGALLGGEGRKDTPGRDKAEREEKQRRKGIRTSQGLKSKIRKLQGLVCKAKFPVDLKP
jgi:hypothetical protein